LCFKVRGKKEGFMKERASFTCEKETLRILDELVKSGKFRNRSHAVEEAVKMLKEKEKGEDKK